LKESPSNYKVIPT